MSKTAEAAPMFSSSHHRQRRSPFSSSFFTPVDLSDRALIESLISVSSDLLSISSPSPLQRKNIRILSSKVLSFLTVFRSLTSSAAPVHLPLTAALCFKELHILLHRSKLLLEYCSQSSRLWLLVRNRQIPGLFHDLSLEISTLLDVFPSSDDALNLSVDVLELIDLLRRQARESTLYIDPEDEVLRMTISRFLDGFEEGVAPDREELRFVFVERLGIVDARICRTEIEFLEEQIYNQEEEVDSSILNGVVALARYARFLLFGFGPEVDFRKFGSFVSGRSNSVKGKVLRELGGDDESESFVSIPKDYICPVSLDLMKDPVVVSTGQTYDRDSIKRWMEDGHNTCPNSGQSLAHDRLIPNRALRSVISQWCMANSVAYDPPESADYNGGGSVAAISVLSKAAVEANRSTTRLLIELLLDGTSEAKTAAARELRLLAKTAKENRSYIAEAGAIPLLLELLSPESSNPVAQENAVTALLNLSIYDKNKSKIMDEEGCLRAIVAVLMNGWTTESRENAAATLFSLSSVHDYKKRITDEDGAVAALVKLLLNGTARGKRDAVTALFNLSTHADSCRTIVGCGALEALLETLETETVAEEAAGALALLLRQKFAAECMAAKHSAIAGLVGLMRTGTPKAKENAVAALLEMCRSGGLAVTEKVAVAPAIAGSIQALLFSGTKRARRKAASLTKLFQRHEKSGAMRFGGWEVGFPFIRTRPVGRPPASTGDSAGVSRTCRWWCL